VAWRSWVPWTLVVIAAVIGLVAALNVWVKRQALSTDNWTNARSKLLENDEIRGALSVYLVNQLYANVDVSAELEKRLPPQAKGLAAPLAGALEDAAVRATNAVLERPRVQMLWKQANRRAHKAFIAFLNGKHELLVSTNGQVVLDLRPLVKQVAEQFGLSGDRLKKLPPDAGQIVIMKGSQLETARRGVKVIRVLSYFLLFLVLALFAAAVYLAEGRRLRLLMACGVSLLIVGLIILVVRRYAGNYLVDALTSNDTAKRPVNAVWAIETSLLRNVGINTVIYGIGIMFAAWIAGASRAATWVRRELAPTMRDHPVVIYGAVALALFIILITGPTDAQRIYPLLILFGIAFAGTEALRRRTAREFPAAGQASARAG
jgi:ABC-type multidrug transport system fused ATPase/permease subunit